MKTPDTIYLTPSEVADELKKRQGLRTQTEFADELGISQPFLANIYGQKRKPTQAILDVLKLEDAGTLYRRKARK